MERLIDVDDITTKEKMFNALRIFYWKYNQKVHKEESRLNNKEWTDSHCFQIKSNHFADLSLFKQIMIAVDNNDGKKYINALLKRLKTTFGHQLGAKEYLALIEGHGMMENTERMLEEYNAMIASGIRLNNDAIVCILHYLIRHGETQQVEDIWEDILANQKYFRLNSMALQSLILCVNKSAHLFADNLLLKMWNFAVLKQGLRANFQCLCLVILSFSKYSDAQNQKMATQLVSELVSDEWMMSLMATNNFQFTQILNSYGNLGQIDKMCTFYAEFIKKYKDNQHDIDALVTLSSFHQKMENMTALNDILKIIDGHLNLNEDLSTNHLIFFHRIAIKCANESMREKISTILEKRDKQNKIKSNVISHFVMNGESHSISTGYADEKCYFDSHRKVDELINEINYQIDTSVCTELSSQIAKKNHLKSHSEKKALAILLKQECKNIKIRVSMRMCQDCHQFFCEVSRHYNAYTIQCIDPRGTHLFQNGICHLCMRCDHHNR